MRKSNDKLYWYGVQGQLLAESDSSGNVISEYIFFGGMRVARRDVATGNVYYYVSDRLGNASVVTNSSGTIVEESDFYPFGAERVISSNLDNNYKFTGHERDAESGLDHTAFRQYACSTGRWLSPDSVRGTTNDPQSWNRYTYGANNPTNMVDPDGAYPVIPTVECYGYWDGPQFFSEGCRCYKNCNPYAVNFHTNLDEHYNRMDRPDAFDRADKAMTEAGKNLAAMLSGALSTDCTSTLETLGVSAAGITGAVSEMVVYEGPGSGENYAQTIWGNTNEAAVRAQGEKNPGTIDDYFRSHPGATAVAQAHGNQVYVNAGLVNSAPPQALMYTVMHEMLHNLTGNVDWNIQGLLGITQDESNTYNITLELMQRCPWTAN